MKWFTIALLAITLTWTDNSNNEDGFRIYRANGITGVYAPIADVGSNVTTFIDANGQAGHCYRVTAFNSTGESQPTNTACMLLVVPLPPGNLGLK